MIFNWALCQSDDRNESWDFQYISADKSPFNTSLKFVGNQDFWVFVFLIYSW